jgi:hypothetical protein
VDSNCCIIEFCKSLPDAVQIGTKAEVPDPPTIPEPDIPKVTELLSIVTVVPAPAINVRYVSPEPAELEDKKALPAVIEVSPVPPPEMLIVLNDFHAVPSHFQDLPLAVKIWFSVGDVGKLSAAIKKPKDFFLFSYLFAINVIKYFFNKKRLSYIPYLNLVALKFCNISCSVRVRL